MNRRRFLALLGAALGGAGTAAATPAETTGPPTTDTPGTGQQTTRTPTFPAAIGRHPMFGVDPARTGHDPDERGPAAPVRTRWCVGSNGSNRLTSIAVVDGVAFVGSPATGLCALDAATGETRWRTGFEGYPDAPTVAGDRVFTTDGNCAYALGIESGRELWATRPGSRTTTSALVADENGDRTVFVAGEDEDEAGASAGSYIAALDAADGSERWRTAVERNTLYGSLAARDGVVFGGGSGYSVHAFDAATGDRRWRVDVGNHADSPAVGSGSVFVGDESGEVHALDPADGSERWTYGTGAEIRASPAVAEETVYVAAWDGSLHALDARTGERRWRFDGGRRLTVSPTVVGRGDDAVVQVGSAQGNLFAVDAADGGLRWSRQLPDAVESGPVVVDGVVLAGDAEGRIHALVDESIPVPAGAGCRIPTMTPAPADAKGDGDGDGVPDERDYAPRDGSVQRRADVTSGSTDEGLGFLPGVGAGTAASTVGVGIGWVLRSRTE